MKPTTFASLAFARKKKQTRREKFPAETERPVPWPEPELLAVLESYYPKAGRCDGKQGISVPFTRFKSLIIGVICFYRGGPFLLETITRRCKLGEGYGYAH